MRRILLIVPVVALLIAACGDSSLLFPQFDEQSSVDISTIPAGSVLEPGNAIPLSVSRSNVSDQDSSTADRMEIDIYDDQGVLVATQSFESVDLMDEIPDVAVPEVGAGLFSLRVRYYDGANLIASTEVPFFVVGGALGITGVSTYPSSFYPGSQGIVQLRAESPDDMDPYVQWWFDGELIDAGYLSVGHDSALVTSPDREGVYALSVELFPSGPPGEAPFEFASPVRYDSQIFVSTDRTFADTDLLPHESYLTLFHLQGDFEDSGSRHQIDENAVMDGTPFGQPELRLDDQVFGYYLDGSSGFTINSAALPYLDSSVSPFSITIRLRPASLGADRQLLLVEDVSGSSLLRLTTDEFGYVSLSVGFVEPNAGSTSAAPLLAPDVTTVLSVSVWPEDDGLQVLWFKDGLLVSVDTLPVLTDDAGLGEESPEASDAADEGSPDGETGRSWHIRPGRTVIGGENGIHGLIDEVGVYFRDEDDQPSSDEGIFADAMGLEYGDNLLYAEGFETQRIPAEVVAFGDVRVTSGALSIGADAHVRVPGFPFGSEALIVEVDLNDPQPDAEVRIALVMAGSSDDAGLSDDEGSRAIEFLTIRGDGLIGDAQTTVVGDAGLLWVVVSSEGEELVAYAQDGTVLASADVIPEEVRVELANGSDGEIRVLVHSVLVRSAAPQLGERLADSSDDGS